MKKVITIIILFYFIHSSIITIIQNKEGEKKVEADGKCDENDIKHLINNNFNFIDDDVKCYRTVEAAFKNAKEGDRLKILNQEVTVEEMLMINKALTKIKKFDVKIKDT
jgi:hypothetical protein